MQRVKSVFPHKEPHAFPIALKWGLLTGLGIVLTHILLHQAGLHPCSLWFYSDFLLLLLGVMLATEAFKRRNQGYISLRCGMVVGGLLSMFTALFSRLYLLLEQLYICDDMLVHLREEKQLELIEQGLSLHELQHLVHPEGPTAWSFVSYNFVFFLFFSLLISLLVAFLIRKDPPPAFVVYNHVGESKKK